MFLFAVVDVFPFCGSYVVFGETWWLLLFLSMTGFETLGFVLGTFFQTIFC